MISIYQIHLTDVEHDRVNEIGHMAMANESPKYYARLEVTNGFEAWKPIFFKHYEKTYEVGAENKEEAFELTNLWHSIDLVHGLRPGYSSSVGDIFEDDGEFYICDHFGFKKIDIK